MSREGSSEKGAGENEWPCSRCDKILSRKQSFKNHAIVKHGWNSDTKSPATEEDVRKVKRELKKEEKAEEEIGPVTLSDDSDDGNKTLRKSSAASLLKRTNQPKPLRSAPGGPLK